MPRNDSGWVKGKLPARVAHAAQATPNGQESAKRIARIKQIQSVGLPLAEALRRRRPSSFAASLHAYQLFGAVALVIGIALAALGIVTGQNLWLLGGIGAGIAAVAFLRAPRAKSMDTSMDGLVLEAENLDKVLEQFAASLPKEAIALLATMKDTLALILSGANAKDELAIPLDDALFARELVARYIPDACRHYSELKAAARSPVQLPGERTAEDSLLDQLGIMNGRLDRMLQAVVAVKADKLVHHEHFIRLKR